MVEQTAAESAATLPEHESSPPGGRSAAAAAAAAATAAAAAAGRPTPMSPAGGQPVVGVPPRPSARPDPSQRLAPMPYVPPAAGKPGYMPHPGYRAPGPDSGYRPAGPEQPYRPPGHDPAYRPGQDPGYRPGQDPNYRPPGSGPDPNYRSPGSAQDPNYRPPGSGPDPNYRPPGSAQDPNYRPPGSAQDPNYRPPGSAQDPNYRPPGSEGQGPPPPPPGATPMPYGSHAGMYGSPYGRPAPAPPPGAQHYPGYPGQQPWPAGAAPPPSVGKPAPGSPLSTHYLRHQISQKLQYGPGQPSRPASQGSDSGGGGGEALAPPPPPPPGPALMGPDGTPLDEGSQHSTLSNASANSEEACRSPRRDGIGQAPPPPPSGLTFPGPGLRPPSVPGQEEDPAAAASPGGPPAGPPGPTAASWTRSPGSASSDAPPKETFTPSSKKAESLGRLFEMDDSPGRREWVSRLLSFMEERGTPILQCPTVSKQPLDLFKLYHFTKERGGFVEVTTNKTWKDVATVMGIGGSSSGAYTLRKHYMKHLLAFECRFDRGGADPAPIIAKFETKSSKKAKRASSPGPQDSFSNSGSLDGFPGGYPPGYPRPEFNGNGPAVPGQGYPGHGYPGQQPPQPGYGQYMPGGPQRPPGAPPPGQEYPPHSQHGQHPQQHPQHPQQHPQHPQQQQQQQYMQQYPNRSYPGGAPPAGPPGAEYRYPGPPPGPTTYGAPPRPPHYPGGGPAAPRTPPPPPQTAGGGSPAATPPPPGYGPPPGGEGGYPPATSSAAPAAGPPGPYTPARPGVSAAPQSQLAKQLSAPPGQSVRPPPPMMGAVSKPTGAASSPTLCRQLAAPPAALVSPAAQQLGVARHGVPYSHAPASVSGGPPRPYSPSAAPPPPPGALPVPGAGRPGQPPVSAPGAAVPYSQHQAQMAQQHQQQHPQQHQQHPQQQQQQQPYGAWRGGQYSQWPPRYPAPGQWGGTTTSTAPPGARPAGRPDRPGVTAKPMPASYLRPTFPPDSVEATLPVLARRRRGTRADVGPVDGWRLTMALRSGQLAESRWALDVLQILSFDDASVSWLGLARMPGLLAALLQHFRQSLAAMFSRRAAGEWFEGGAEGEPEPDLGVCRPADTTDSEKVLHGADYTRVSRLGRAVELADCSETILVSPRRRAWEADSADADGGWDHVLTHVKVESGRIPFQRRLVDGRIREEPADELMEDAPKVNGQAPLDERLAGFEEPGFFLSRLRRVAPPADCGEGVKPSAGDNVKSSAEGDVKPGGDSDQDAKPNADGVKSDAKPSANYTKGDACDASVKQEAMDVDVKQEPGEPPVQEEGESAVKAEPVAAEEGKPVALPNGAVSPPAPAPSGILPRGSLKRPPPDEEDECQQRDESSLFLTSETQESVATRCLAASTILRNLSFVPGNEAELATEPVLVLLGDLLQLHHRHPPRAAAHTNYDRDEDADQREPCPAFGGDDWWADFLPALHEHALVTLTNIGGHVRLGGHDEAVVRPVLDGLLHWVQCRSSYAADPLPVSGAALPAARLALEALCRLCVHADNVDLLLATPPGWRLERVCRLAAGWVAAEGDQVRREMALTLLHALAAVDERVGRVLAAETDLTATLVRFVEAAEQSAMSVANSQGVNALRENPDLMGTSLDLLGRAAGLLVSLAPLAEARPALVRCEARLLALVTSQILDQRVAAQLSRVLYTVALPAGERGV